MIGFAGEFILGSTDVIRCQWCAAQMTTLFIYEINIYTIAIMAFDRFIYIYKPSYYERKATCYKTFVVLIVVWVVLSPIAFLFSPPVWPEYRTH